MGIEDEEQIWNILKKNPYAMNKLRQIASGGTMVLSDMLTEWELGIGALQSKIIRRIAAFCSDQQNKNKSNEHDKNSDNKEPEKENENESQPLPPKTNDNDNINGSNVDVDKKEDK